MVARSASDASERVRAAGLEPITEMGDRFSPGGAGTVAAQDPPAGASLAVGSRVRLVIASGNVVVPNVVGMPEQQAESTLHAAGLNVTIRHAANAVIAGGSAARTDPPADSQVESGSRVTLTVSLGR